MLCKKKDLVIINISIKKKETSEEKNNCKDNNEIKSIRINPNVKHCKAKQLILIILVIWSMNDFLGIL